MRFLGLMAFAIVAVVVGSMPAVAAAKIKISYSWVYDRIRPDPQKNVKGGILKDLEHGKFGFGDRATFARDALFRGRRLAER